MTMTLRRQSRTDRFQESGLFSPVAAGTVGVTAVAAATSFPNWVSIATVVTVIAVLGRATVQHG